MSVLDDIRATYRNLDINSQESELTAQAELDAMAGEGDETPAEDVNIPDSMPLAEAVAMVTDAQTEGFQVLRGIAEQMQADFARKAEDVKATQDSRTIHAHMALGIKKLLVEWGEKILEATERLQTASVDEKRTMGVDVKAILDSPTVDDRPVGKPSAGVLSSTKRAAEFFAKKS